MHAASGMPGMMSHTSPGMPGMMSMPGMMGMSGNPTFPGLETNFPGMSGIGFPGQNGSGLFPGQGGSGLFPGQGGSGLEQNTSLDDILKFGSQEGGGDAAAFNLGFPGLGLPGFPGLGSQGI